VWKAVLQRQSLAFGVVEVAPDYGHAVVIAHMADNPSAERPVGYRCTRGQLGGHIFLSRHVGKHSRRRARVERLHVQRSARSCRRE
jgi:hypothetical protein